MAAAPLPQRDGDWRGLLLVVGVFFGSLLVAAVLAPLVYLAVQGWADSSSARLASYLAEKDFPRYFDRLRWLVVLVGLPWLCRTTGIRGGARLGLAFDSSDLRRLTCWFGFGVTMVAVLCFGQLAAGVAVWDDRPFGAIVELVLLATVSAALIGFLEELVFRGVVFRLARRALAPIAAAGATATIYALMHFQRVPSDVWDDDTPVTLGTGFVVALGNVRGMIVGLEPALLLGLIAAGLVFCLLVERSEGSIAPSIGLHAGWVFAALLHRRLFEHDGSSALWGGRSLLDGVVAGLLLAGLLGWLGWRRGRDRPRGSPAAPPGAIGGQSASANDARASASES